jgi:hypothetical protein
MQVKKVCQSLKVLQTFSLSMLQSATAPLVLRLDILTVQERDPSFLANTAYDPPDPYASHFDRKRSCRYCIYYNGLLGSVPSYIKFPPLNE